MHNYYNNCYVIHNNIFTKKFFKKVLTFPHKSSIIISRGDDKAPIEREEKRMKRECRVTYYVEGILVYSVQVALTKDQVRELEKEEGVVVE